MEIKAIDASLLCSLHEEARKCGRLRMNHDLRTGTHDTSQRMLNALEPGTQVSVHRHSGTTETVICIEGRMDVVLYERIDGEGQRFVETGRVSLCPQEGNFGVQIPVGAWHSVEVFEPSTIFEAKDGAYVTVP